MCMFLCLRWAVCYLSLSNLWNMISVLCYNIELKLSFVICFVQWSDHTSFCWSHKRRSECCIFCGQPSDCVRLARQDYQVVEHSGSLQIHDPGVICVFSTWFLLYQCNLCYIVIFTSDWWWLTNQYTGGECCPAILKSLLALYFVVKFNVLQ